MLILEADQAVFTCGGQRKRRSHAQSGSPSFIRGTVSLAANIFSLGGLRSLFKALQQETQMKVFVWWIPRLLWWSRDIFFLSQWLWFWIALKCFNAYETLAFIYLFSLGWIYLISASSTEKTYFSQEISSPCVYLCSFQFLIIIPQHSVFEWHRLKHYYESLEAHWLIVSLKQGQLLLGKCMGQLSAAHIATRI